MSSLVRSPLSAGIVGILAVALASLFAGEAAAQGTTRPGASSPGGKTNAPTSPGNRPAVPANKPVLPIAKTIVAVELIQGKDGGLTAHEWGQVFEKLGVDFRIRQSVLDDKAETQERYVGTTRLVTVIGKLERGGQAVFADRAFTRADGAKIKEWLDELKTFGAQGKPDGKPLWGLSEAQFAVVYSALGKRVENEVAGLTLTEALTKIGPPEKYPVRLSLASKEWLASEFPKQPAVRNKLDGMALGTGLAVLLNDYGLGYRPLRTPSGSLELAVDPLKVVKDVWPIGWELKMGQTRQQTAPKLFEMIPVELNAAKLTDVLAAVAEKTDLPVHVDHYRIEGKNLDLETLTVTIPPKRTTWSLLLKSATTPHKLTRRLLIDELGKPFLWVTVLDPKRKDDF